jgi:hypothetical protein
MSRLKFLENVQDPELRRDIATILLNLKALSEMPAARIGRSSPSADKEYAGPPKTTSLYDDYLEAFTQAQGELALYKVLWKAQKEYNDLVTPYDHEERIAGRLSRADDALLRRTIVEHFEGEHSHKLHIQLSLSQGWIEHVRLQADRDPTWGTPRIAWKGSEAEKRAVIAAMKEGGTTQQQAAQALRVSVRTVANYWRAA